MLYLYLSAMWEDLCAVQHHSMEMGSKHVLHLQAAIEQLMQEWKVDDFGVAESIFKSRQRQLRQKGGAQLRQKMLVYIYPCHQSCTLTTLSTYLC